MKAHTHTYTHTHKHTHTAAAEREALQRHEGIVELYARFVDDCHLSDVSVTVSHYQLRVLG